jgi:hypothetical protein
MHRRGRTREVIDALHAPARGQVLVDGRDHVALAELEARLVAQLGEVLATPRGEVIQAQDLVSVGHESIAKMGAEKPGATGHKNTLHDRAASASRKPHAGEHRLSGSGTAAALARYPPC